MSGAATTLARPSLWEDRRGPIYLAVMAGLLIATGVLQSWSVALAIVNLGLISAVMALGVNIQWGYAGLMNAGVMGFAALGGLAGVLIAQAPVSDAWSAGGTGVLAAAAVALATVAAAVLARRALARGALRAVVTAGLVIAGYLVARAFFDPAVRAIESVDAARTGYLGGLDLPILIAWPVGGLFAAGAAWLIGKAALGLRSDYLAIATLGVAEIVVAILKNEEWLARGVKNVTGLDRPVPYEVDLQADAGFVAAAQWLGATPIDASSAAVKLAYAALFGAVLLILIWLSERALNSPWGRMMRAIRDNETAAAAMGKDVTARHLQVFILGSAVIGIAGAMLTTLDGQFTPGSYNPLRYTFIIWVMVIVGGSGNNWGSVLGGFLIWFAWVQAEPLGRWAMDVVTAGLAEGDPWRRSLLDAADHLRMLLMGMILLLTLRFSPQGLLPERGRG